MIRSLSNKPVEIIALSYEGLDIAHRSKYVSSFFKIPHPVKQEKEFIDFLLSKTADWKDSIIFETDDNVATTVSKYKTELRKHFIVVSSDMEKTSVFLDKQKAWKIALDAGVKHPKNFVAKKESEFAVAREKITYPCLFKPAKGHEFFTIFSKKNFEVTSPSDFDKYAEQCFQNEVEIMIQEIIPGPDTNIYKGMTYINSKNKPAGIFFYRKDRQNPPNFGVGRVSHSTAVNKEVEDLSFKILKQANYTGYCNVEFKKDPRDGSLNFIEVNIRMSRMISLPTNCGINFPWIILNDLIYDKQIYFEHYIEDFYWIEMYADLLNAIFRKRQEKYTIQEYLAPYRLKNKTFAIWDKKDIKPFILQSVKLPRLLFR